MATRISAASSQDTRPVAVSSSGSDSAWVSLLAMALGLAAAFIILPAWIPNITTSLLGPDAKFYWYLSRSTAFVGFGLLWLSMSLGIMITNKMAQVWPGGPTAAELHQHTSLLGLGFGLVHGLLLMGDQYINFNLAQVLTPFSTAAYLPQWVGLGQLAFYVWGIIVLSYYVRRQIGRKTWRAIHFFSYLVFALTLLHGIFAGTDTGKTWVTGLYWVSGSLVLFLTIYRIFYSVNKARQKITPS
jgi:predicted ferric reductase